MNHENPCRLIGGNDCVCKTREFREGDLVQVVNGEQIVRGRLEGTKLYLGTKNRLKMPNFRYFIDAAEANGWTVKLIEAAPEPKPFTKGEFYTDKEGDLWFAEGEDWVHLRPLTHGGKRSSSVYPSDRVKSYAPFRHVTLNRQAAVIDL